MSTSPDAVFLNVPFDIRYKKLFDALVFAVYDCGFVPRGALEQDDGSQVRLDKIMEIIGQCRLSIHDLSRTSLDSKFQLPRFNMPLELGIFLGAKRYGGSTHARKSCLILDRDQYRYQVFCSDIAGQDIRAHDNDVSTAVRHVRNWLQANLSTGTKTPGPAAINKRYVKFRQDLPKLALAAKLVPRELNFLDYRTLVKGWLAENAW